MRSRSELALWLARVMAYCMCTLALIFAVGFPGWVEAILLTAGALSLGSYLYQALVQYVPAKP